MPDLLLEFFSEEIPARMQARAAEDLKKLVTDKLIAAGLTYDGAKAFATPRRLALAVAGIPVRQPDIKDERKGPKVGAPEQAIAGFLRAAGLASIDQAKVQPDKKGDFYVAVIDKPGRPAIEVIAGIVPDVAKAFPWPKAMRWGEGSAKPGALNWVRPLHSIVAMFGPETEEPDVVAFDVGGVAAGNTTYGHRFLSPQPIKVKRLDDYMAKLNAAKVVVDPARRAQMILADAKTLAFAQGFELVEDEGLLAEVAGLVEWPVVLMGSFDKEFLAIPEEVIRATIRNNQKCFVVRDPKTAKLANKFILVANIIGLIPYTFTVTSHIIITAALALLVFITVLVYGFTKNGLGFFRLFVPQGIPIYILPLIVFIEVLSFLSRPISHSVRLFANMLAGHITLKVFASFITLLGGLGIAGVVGATLPLALVVALTALELLVAFLQAYVFAILTCIYLNDAIHPGH